MKRFLMTLMVTAAFQAPALAQSADLAAQEADGDSRGLADIVVTAQKRAESLQDTPISISALDVGALEAKRVVSLADLSSAVPNMQVSPHPNTGTTLRVTIRGIGEPAATQTRDNPVAVYVDGVYVAKGQGLANELAELERIEVLRGPQGTLYGRNATAGAINFISKAPQLGDFSAQQSLSFGSFSEFRSRSSINIPFGETAAAELTYLRVKKDGFVRNLGPGEGRFGDVDREAVRAALRWQPTDAFEARYTYDSSWIDDTSTFSQSVPLYPAEGTLSRTASSGLFVLRPGNTQVQGHNLTLIYDINSSLTIKSITGYRRLNDNTNQVYNPGPVRAFLPFSNTNSTNQEQFSEELQLIGDLFDDSVKYVGGLYYFRESGFGDDNSLMPSGYNPRHSTWENTAYAVFGQATWTPRFMDERLHITVGARWSRDEREATVLSTRTPPGGATVLVLEGSGKKGFNDFSPTGTIQFDVNQDANVYAKITRGYRTGGFNPTASTPATFAAGFKPESLMSYEAGFKSEFFDRRIRFNVAAYHSKYKDIQTNVFDPFNPRIFDIINAGSAVTQGFEADLMALLFDGMTISGSYGYTNPKYKKVVDLGGNDITSNFNFQHAPKNSFTLGADYKSPETSVGIVEANVNYAWQDKYFGVASDPKIITHAYGLLGARLGLTNVLGVEGLRVAVWGRNLTNVNYYRNHFALGDVAAAMFGEPRSMGVDISMKF
ncbi:TonB-dependent receptor [Sphingomonas sp. C3-2]|uniref:TonB-dependent receptor n=1 Tax=Sphingomonas sp. C3-2 TaxID=3062169 RepID=UPI00294B7644|nr:TonB-dependent receptor [Sphingomonas sp. C3-2]WOK37282.1 TonB-dependent receptor [Sphingomonas sp. C3-2]